MRRFPAPMFTAALLLLVGAAVVSLLIMSISSNRVDDSNLVASMSAGNTIDPTHAIETVWQQNWANTETAFAPARATHIVTMTARATYRVELRTSNARRVATYGLATRNALQTLNALPTATPIPRSVVETWAARNATGKALLATWEMYAALTRTPMLATFTAEARKSTASP